MKILLTGASGFLGSVCLSSLRAASHEIVTTDRIGDVDLYGDLTQPEFVRSLPDVDAVVHCAAVQYLSRDLPLLFRQRYFLKNNALATRQICDRYRDGVTYMLNIGSSMMYWQNHAGTYAPSSPMRGQGIYSTTKLSAQKLIQSSFKRWGTVVPCIIGGAGRGGLFRRLVEAIRLGQSIVIPGHGTNPTHIVHVRDVAQLITIMVNSRAQGIYNAGAPEPQSILDWIQEIATHLRVSSVNVRHVPLRLVHWISAATGYRILAREQLQMLAQPHVLDISTSLAVGWKPIFTNAQIVREIATSIANSASGAKSLDVTGRRL